MARGEKKRENVGERGPKSSELGVNLERRLSLLGGVAAFARLPSAALEGLAKRLEEERYATGETVVVEGEEGDRLYLVVGGQAEVSVSGRAGPVPLATLGPGEVFGEIALLEPGGRRQATVAATTPLLALSLAASGFHRLLVEFPEVQRAFSEAEEEMLVAKFLKQASPFATLDVDGLAPGAPAVARRDYTHRWAYTEAGCDILTGTGSGADEASPRQVPLPGR